MLRTNHAVTVLSLLLLLGQGAFAQAPAPQAVTPTEPPAPAVQVITPDEPPVKSALIVPPITVPPATLAVPPPRPKPRPQARVPKPAPAPRLVVTEKAVTYGHSGQSRPLTAWVLDNAPRPQADTTLIFGGFHGDERTTPGVVARLRHDLKARPQAWAGRRVVLVPCANPDGWAAGTRFDARGVDLNRNFPAEWADTGRAARYSPGPSPISEPETRAMIHLLRLFHPAKVVSLHSPLHLLNWTGPVGRAMAQAMSRADGYRVTGDIGYPTPGSLGNYCGALGIGIVTLELPQESESASWAANRGALLAAIQFRPHP